METVACGALLVFAAVLAPHASATAGEEEKKLAQAQPAFTDANFDGWVFQHHGTLLAARKYLQAQLNLQVERMDRICKLTDAQRDKLLLAGRGDIKRFFDQYEEMKKRFQMLKHDRQNINQIFQEIAPLQSRLRAGLFHEDSFLYKTLQNTLTETQLAQYAAVTRERRALRHRATIELLVTTFEQITPLTEEQRQKLITLLLEKTKPSRSSSQMGSYLILWQMSHLPEKTLKPLFDPVQWKVVTHQMAQARGMEAWLRQNGHLKD